MYRCSCFTAYDSNHIGDEVAVALADALKENNSLTSINLERNHIGDEGAVALADVLKENSSLASLDLSLHNIGDKVAKALADALKANSSLASINLDSNHIGDEVAVALADALKENNSLIYINLIGNINIGNEYEGNIKKEIRINLDNFIMELSNEDLNNNIPSLKLLKLVKSLKYSDPSLVDKIKQEIGNDRYDKLLLNSDELLSNKFFGKTLQK